MMTFQKLKTADLLPANYNPRKDLQPTDSEYKKIKRSIEEFGYVDPIIVNKDKTVVGGHQRLKVLKDLGFDEIDCVVVDVDKDHEKALNIALNKISGEWDNTRLADLLQELDTGAFDVELTGFDLDEIAALLAPTDQEVVEDDFNVETAAKDIKEPITHKGDIWQLGRHRLICGDSTEQKAIAQLMDGMQARLIITDPPYNVNYEGGTGLKIKNDNMGDSAFYEFLVNAYNRMFESAEPGCPIYVFHADTEGLNFRQAYADAGFKLSECLIWVKNSLVLGHQDYHWKHEPILYGWKEGGAHHWYGNRDKDTVQEDNINIGKLTKAQMGDLLKELLKGKEDTTIIREDKPSRNDVHPTMKPLKLIGSLMKNSSTHGDIVLDSFGGSGSTLMAAEQLGRTCYTSEFDEVYCDVIIKRWEDFTGEIAVRITEGGESDAKTAGSCRE
jgi:DNA modification methylase